MQKQTLRVMVAAEKSRVRKLFKRVAETEGGVIIVGEAETSSEVLTLARDVRPDVVLMDLYLPGGKLRDVRMSGLDAAQTLATELPDALVALVTNPDVSVTSRFSSDSTVHFLKEESSGQVSLSLDEIYQSRRSKMPLFAGIGVKPMTLNTQDLGKMLPSVSAEHGGALFYVVGVTALAFFFSPFVMIYFMVKAASKITAALHTRIRKVEVVNELSRSPEDVPRFLHT